MIEQMGCVYRGGKMGKPKKATLTINHQQVVLLDKNDKELLQAHPTEIEAYKKITGAVYLYQNNKVVASLQPVSLPFVIFGAIGIFAGLATGANNRVKQIVQALESIGVAPR